MPPMTKKPCINSSEWTYTGKEVSPTGLGYAPDGETEGTQMKGRDDTMWIVGRKNGVKVWNRVPVVLVKEEPVIVHETPKKLVDTEDEANSEDEKDEDEVKPPTVPTVPKKVKNIEKKEVVPVPEVLKVVPEVPPKTEPVVVPEKKKRAPAKKKEVFAVVPEAPAVVPEVVPEAPAVVPEVVPEAPAVVPEAPAVVPEKKKRAPAKKKVVAEAPAVVAEETEVPAAVPEKKKRAPAKKKTGGEEDKKEVKSDYQIYLVHRLTTIKGATHKERFGAAAKEWGAMTEEEKNAAVADLK